MKGFSIFASFIKVIAIYFFLHAPSFATPEMNSCIKNIGEHYHSKCYPGGECELPYLDFYQCGLSDCDIPYILKYIETTHPDLAKILLERNHITSSGLKILLKHNDFVIINLNFNEIDDTGGIELGSIKLSTLEINNNRIGNKGLIGLLRNPVLNVLSIANNVFDIAGIKALENNSSLSTLDISNNHIGPKEARIIATISQLQSLIADNNNLGNEGVKIFANLERSYLNFSFNNNNISDQGAIELSHNQSSQINLSLNQNKISSRGFQALVRNKSLLSLHIAENQINDQALRALADNKKIHTLDISGNKIGLEGTKILANLHRIREPIYLLANNNLFGDDGVILLANSWNFIELSLRYNNLHNESVSALINSHPLRYIDVRNNHIGKSGIQRLEDSDKYVLTEDNDGTD